MDIKGLAAVVTGAASGLGEATARALAARGAKVTLFDLNEDRGRRVAQEIGGLFHRVDVSSEADVTAGLDAGEAAHGTARVAVSCAGIGPAAKTVSRGEAHPLDSFKKVIDVNLVGTFNVLRLAAARMAAAEPVDGEERGVIVNTASIAAYEGQVGQAAYAASKGGVVGLTLPVARDLADKQVRVMTIAPGLFLTPLLLGLPQEVQDSLGRTVPHPHRLGDPGEYAKLACHIVENPMLNGEVIRLDGALRMQPK
ncbi:3-hydroxyacyl-CoA dehydrogenase [Rhodothalassium salexigens]|uniref:SDR family NAD(P)-dependent oxidoreductase n=1 Tax=Rhodothalassium salexigens TaxID=1086 RepID=UPI00191440E2|nr:SDR family NAD(P)-dependent oxidoreductase [Rhodothalassium salexigens]MBK5921906.1 3-hydroxyacyl-CoA dehydrogenase [Rhodothalassium salexigens]